MRSIALACALLMAGPVQAELQARDLDPNLPGHEAVYDTARDITWLADANINGDKTFAEHVAFGASHTAGDTTGWRISTDTELRGLFQDWYRANFDQFGTEGLSKNVADGADVGYGSRLFFNQSSWYMVDDYYDGLRADLTIFYLNMITHDFGHVGDRVTTTADAWFVRDGDTLTLPVPEPATWATLLLGCLLLVSLKHVYRATSPAPMSSAK